MKLTKVNGYVHNHITYSKLQKKRYPSFMRR